MFTLVNTTVPLLVESSISSAPVPAPEIMPPNVAVVPVAAAILLAPAANVMALPIVLDAVANNVPPLIVTVPVDKLEPEAPPEETDNVPPAIDMPPINILLPENITIPLLVASPTARAPVPAPEMVLVKVIVVPVAAAILLLPLANVIVLVMVLVVLPNNVPPPMVTAPVDKLEPLAPPVANDKVPPLMMVPPL